MRSEDELRAAFQQKAAEAPPAVDVLRAVRAREGAPRGRRRWLMPAIAGAAAVAVGVPLGLALSHPSSTSTKKSAGGAYQQTAAAPGGASAGSAAESGKASRGARPNATTALPICRPADVTVRAQSDALRITSHGESCLLARVPSVRAGAVPPAPAREFGTLPPDATATAPLHWSGGCARPAAGVVRVDWGAGPVEVPIAATPGHACAQPGATVSAGPFTGLT